jgi:hypothetical protein
MQEGDETDLFWNALNEPTHQRKYYSLLNGKLWRSSYRSGIY